MTAPAAVPGFRPGDSRTRMPDDPQVRFITELGEVVDDALPGRYRFIAYPTEHSAGAKLFTVDSEFVCQLRILFNHGDYRTRDEFLACVHDVWEARTPSPAARAVRERLTFDRVAAMLAAHPELTTLTMPYRIVYDPG